MSLRNFILLCVILSPYVLLWFLVPDFSFYIYGNWTAPLVNGIQQAFLSAILALILGFFLSRSLFACRDSRSLSRIRTLLLAPNFIPPLYVILSAMNFSSLVGISHQGLGWVVALHALINGGLFAVAFHSHYSSRVQASVGVASTLGARPLRRFLKVTLPLSASLVVQNFFLIFVICLMSFSIPFVLSGGAATSLEVHIYKLVRSEGQWGMALFYSSIQTLVVLTMAGLILLWPASKSSATGSRFVGARLNRSWRLLAWLPLLFLGGFWFLDVIRFVFFSTWLATPTALLKPSLLFNATINTASIFALVFIFQLGFCLLSLSSHFSRPLEHFFKGYMAPSVAVLGFSMSLLPGTSDFLILLKNSLCFTFLTFPVLFRWQVLERWKALGSQVDIARVFGATYGDVYWRIIWPQLKSACYAVAVMAAIWSLGDFAVSSFFMAPEDTLALMVVELLNRYQMDQASFLSFVIFVVGGSIFYTAQKVLSRVSY